MTADRLLKLMLHRQQYLWLPGLWNVLVRLSGKGTCREPSTASSAGEGLWAGVVAGNRARLGRLLQLRGAVRGGEARGRGYEVVVSESGEP